MSSWISSWIAHTCFVRWHTGEFHASTLLVYVNNHLIVLPCVSSIRQLYAIKILVGHIWYSPAIVCVAHFICVFKLHCAILLCPYKTQKYLPVTIQNLDWKLGSGFYGLQTNNTFMCPLIPCEFNDRWTLLGHSYQLKGIKHLLLFFFIWCCEAYCRRNELAIFHLSFTRWTKQLVKELRELILLLFKFLYQLVCKVEVTLFLFLKFHSNIANLDQNILIFLTYLISNLLINIIVFQSLINLLYLFLHLFS